MTHTYAISGMTCGKCVAKVKTELLKLGDILSADVKLDAPQASITMSNPENGLVGFQPCLQLW